MATGEKLGCASTYTVALHWQGGDRVFTYLDKVVSVGWGRERSSVSTCTVELSKPEVGAACLEKLAQVWPWVHEVTVYRDGQAVWQGPVVRYPKETRTSITITAKDVARWLGVRLLRQNRKLQGADLADIGRAAIGSALAVRDPNILAHVVARPTGEVADRTIRAYSRTGADELDEIAGQGLDWTAVGRTLYLAPPATDQTPPQAQLRSLDLLGDVEVEANGEEYASLVYAAPQAQEGVWQHVEGVGGASPYFGLVEYVVQTSIPWQRDDNGDFQPSGQDGMGEAETNKALRRAARQRHEQVSRPPIAVRCPDQAQLSPEAPVSLERLVPGARIDLVLGGEFIWRVSRPMRLGRVDVDWSVDREVVKVALTQIGLPGENQVEAP